VTAAMDLAGIFQFVSKAVPGARHDIERLRQIQAEFEQGIDERDVIVADKGYQGFENDANVGTWCIKKKKPKHQNLSAEQTELNEKIERVRRHIEFGFGSVKIIFDCLLTPWRHDRSWLTPVIHFCFALHNVKVRYEKISDIHETEWKHPIPQICNSKSDQKKVFLLFNSLYHCTFSID
jgi:hypothetical protein